MIDVIFCCALISILCTIALPKMLMARQSAGAASAIGSMRAINSSELTFALTCGNGFYAPDLTSLTGGRGDYAMTLARYEEVPAHVSQRLIADLQREREAAKA